MLYSALFFLSFLALLTGQSAAKGVTAGIPKSHWLIAHNKNRAHYQAHPLAYANNLQSSTQSWANNCVFKHSKGNYGENIAVFASAPKPPKVDPYSAMNGWMSEAKAYYAKKTSVDTGHFTQVVWKSTKKMACAAAHCPKGTIYKTMASLFYVCRYTPPGNVAGEYSKNVGTYKA